MEEEGSTMVEITINVGGEDYLVTVDHETAQELLNDQYLAEQYVKRAFQQSNGGIDETFLVEESPFLTQTVELKKVWFSKGKPTAYDDEATEYFLKLRQKYSGKFDDRKSVKNKLWAAIADDMKAAGYDIGNSKEGPAAKCKQKFQNLESKYIKHIQHMKTTGSEYKDTPPYYDLLHSILSHKHKINPEHLQDSETETSTSSIQESASEDDTSSVQIKNRFKADKPKPKVNRCDKLIDELKRQFEVEKSDREKFLGEIKAANKEQNKQRQDLIDILSQLVSKKPKND